MDGEDRERPMVILLLVLSATTGLIDAVSVLGLGKVFTANMTGNIVFLGFAIARVPGYSWESCIAALLAFLIGAAAAARIGKAHLGRSRRRWLVTIAAGEAVMLWGAAICGYFAGPTMPLLIQLSMIVLTAVAMGARNATVRQLKVADLTTTVLTLTVTGLAADSSFAGGNNHNRGRRFLAVVAILVGATAGAIMTELAGIALPLLAAGIIILAATLLLVRDEETPSRN